VRGRLVCNETTMTYDITLRPAGSGADCASILAEIPEWFGMPQSNANYARLAEEGPAYVVEVDGRAEGLMILKPHFDSAVEIYFLAVRPGRHRKGIGRALVEAGLHPATGGTGLLACSGDMLLEALVACAGVTLRAVATSLGLDVHGTVRAEGDLDFRGTLGVAKDEAVPVGFTAIRLRFDLVHDEDDAAIAKLLELTERYCVVFQTLAGGVPVELA